MTDFQIPTVAHGGRRRIPRNDPKLLRQRGAIRGLVRGARHKSATVTEDDLATYGRELVAQYEVGTVAVKLAGIRQLYEAAVWCGLRQDNPAAGLKAPKDKTERSERIKFLSLDGLRRILDAPRGNDPAAVRDRAMLALVGRHELRVSEVAGLTVDAVDLGWYCQSFRQGHKTRTVYFTETSIAALRHRLIRLVKEARGGSKRPGS